jgi:hypothetical protein
MRKLREMSRTACYLRPFGRAVLTKEKSAIRELEEEVGAPTPQLAVTKVAEEGALALTVLLMAPRGKYCIPDIKSSYIA